MNKELNDQEDVIEDLPADVPEGEEDKTDWKALALKNQGIAKRLKTKLEKAKEVKPKAKPKVKKAKVEGKEKKEGFDYAELAYLIAKGYSRKKEQAAAAEMMKETGKSLREVLSNKHFKNDIKDMRELKASNDAIPSGTKRTAKSTKDKVEYWVARGEMPPADQPQLRRDYVNAKTKATTSGDKLSKNPVRGHVK